MAGGLYDQDPDLLDGFQVIFSARAQYEEEERNKENAKRNRGMGSKSGQTPMKRRR